jgi:CubicO group peptidase (beta-lactamase class C family)
MNHVVKNMRSIWVIFLLGWGFSGCMKDENIKINYEGYIPEALDDGWEISTPGQEGFSEEGLNEVYNNFYSEDLYPAIYSLLIVRNGKLVAEAYCRDKKDRDRFHSIQSATKSITSLLVGIAIDQGLIDSVNQKVYDYIPEYFDDDVNKREISIRDVLTMETGLDFDNDKHTVELINWKGSTLEYVLHKNLIFTPGTDWYYGDGNPQLLSGVIQKVTGKTEEEFARENLFEPLNISIYQWEKAADGLTIGAVGLWLRPRDMAKIGKLMVQDGMWEGRQIVSPDWIAESTRRQSSHQNYGYYWYPWEEEDAYFAAGHGGQLIYVVPDQQLSIVITADSYSNSAALASRFNELFLGIGSSIIE